MEEFFHTLTLLPIQGERCAKKNKVLGGLFLIFSATFLKIFSSSSFVNLLDRQSQFLKILFSRLFILHRPERELRSHFTTTNFLFIIPSLLLITKL